VILASASCKSAPVFSRRRVHRATKLTRKVIAVLESYRKCHLADRFGPTAEHLGSTLNAEMDQVVDGRLPSGLPERGEQTALRHVNLHREIA